MPRRRNINKRTAWLAEAAPETELGMSTGTGTGDLARPALAFLSTRTHHSPQESSRSATKEKIILFETGKTFRRRAQRRFRLLAVSVLALGKVFP